MAGNGPAQLKVLAGKLRAEAEGGLERRTTRRLRAVAEPLKADVRGAARRRLPSSGGLNERVASQPISATAIGGRGGSGVRLRSTSPAALETNEGFVLHPLPSNDRSEWITQLIPQAVGWWTDTLRHSGAREGAAALAAVGREVQADLEV